MKKFLIVLFALVGCAFASEGAASGAASGLSDIVKATSILAAVIGLGIAAFGGALGMGHTAAATISGTARNPGLGGKLMTTMFIALAMIEAQVIYALVFALIVLYANPFA